MLLAGNLRAVTDNSPELVALLPHRPPFRFVDAVDKHAPGESVQARYLVPGRPGLTLLSPGLIGTGSGATGTGVNRPLGMR